MSDDPPRSAVADLTGVSGQQKSTQKLLDQIPQFIPGVPNSAWIPILWGQLRGIVTTLAGLGFGWARYVEGSEFQQYLTGAIIVGTLGLSGWSKVSAEIAKYRAAAVSADASANATANNTPVVVAPVSVAVTPAGVKVI